MVQPSLGLKSGKIELPSVVVKKPLGSNQIGVNPLANPSFNSSNLQISIQPKKDDEDPLTGSYYYESDIHEDIPVTLILPNGEKVTLKIKIGETVANVKYLLEVHHGIEYNDSTLYLNDQVMIDPLSLNDYPSILRHKCATIRVVVRESNKEVSHPAATHLPGSSPDGEVVTAAIDPLASMANSSSSHTKEMPAKSFQETTSKLSTPNAAAKDNFMEPEPLKKVKKKKRNKCCFLF